MGAAGRLLHSLVLLCLTLTGGIRLLDVFMLIPQEMTVCLKLEFGAQRLWRAEHRCHWPWFGTSLIWIIFLIRVLVMIPVKGRKYLVDIILILVFAMILVLENYFGSIAFNYIFS